jgi:hypothetical protein
MVAPPAALRLRGHVFPHCQCAGDSAVRVELTLTSASFASTLQEGAGSRSERGLGEFSKEIINECRMPSVLWSTQIALESGDTQFQNSNGVHVALIRT